VAVDDGVLRRGELRYGVYCGPCHGPQADGKGMLFQRAKVASADLLSARIRAMPAGQLYDVITHGVGLMPPYGAQVPVDDRWAIVAFVQKLQADSPPRAEDGTTGDAATAPGEGVTAAPADAGAGTLDAPRTAEGSPGDVEGRR
jgi:mono/diheme cytochrome c family protein